MGQTHTEEIYKQYPGNARIHEFKDKDGVICYEFKAPMHEGREFSNKWAAELYADVYWAVDSFREEKSGERGVPPEIAIEGKPEIAAYLLTSPSISMDWIMTFFDVERETIHTYLSRVRSKAEAARENYESGVGEE